MCGRYTLGTFDWVDPAFHTDLAQLGDLVRRPRYNVAPGQMVLALTRGEGGRTVAESMHWGIEAPWTGGPAQIINAKAERLAGSRFWKSLLENGRCAIPADGFYEWRAAEAPGGRKQPYWFSRVNAEGFAFAGLCRKPKPDAESPPAHDHECVIITVAANDLVAGVHDRMPAMLTPSDAEAWLEGDVDEALSLLDPFPSTDMEARPVGAAVGSPRNEGSHLIAPLPEAPGPAGFADNPLF